MTENTDIKNFTLNEQFELDEKLLLDEDTENVENPAPQQNTAEDTKTNTTDTQPKNNETQNEAEVESITQALNKRAELLQDHILTTAKNSKKTIPNTKNLEKFFSSSEVTNDGAWDGKVASINKALSELDKNWKQHYSKLDGQLQKTSSQLENLELRQEIINDLNYAEIDLWERLLKAYIQGAQKALNLKADLIRKWTDQDDINQDNATKTEIETLKSKLSELDKYISSITNNKDPKVILKNCKNIIQICGFGDSLAALNKKLKEHGRQRVTLTTKKTNNSTNTNNETANNTSNTSTDNQPEENDDNTDNTQPTDEDEPLNYPDTSEDWWGKLLAAKGNQKEIDKIWADYFKKEWIQRHEAKSDTFDHIKGEMIKMINANGFFESGNPGITFTRTYAALNNWNKDKVTQDTYTWIMENAGIAGGSEHATFTKKDLKAKKDETLITSRDFYNNKSENERFRYMRDWAKAKSAFDNNLVKTDYTNSHDFLMNIFFDKSNGQTTLKPILIIENEIAKLGITSNKEETSYTSGNKNKLTNTFKNDVGNAKNVLAALIIMAQPNENELNKYNNEVSNIPATVATDQTKYNNTFKTLGIKNPATAKTAIKDVIEWIKTQEKNKQ